MRWLTIQDSLRGITRALSIFETPAVSPYWKKDKLSPQALQVLYHNRRVYLSPCCCEPTLLPNCYHAGAFAWTVFYSVLYICYFYVDCYHWWWGQQIITVLISSSTIIIICCISNYQTFTLAATALLPSSPFTKRQLHTNAKPTADPFEGKIRDLFFSAHNSLQLVYNYHPINLKLPTSYLLLINLD